MSPKDQDRYRVSFISSAQTVVQQAKALASWEPSETTLSDMRNLMRRWNGIEALSEFAGEDSKDYDDLRSELEVACKAVGAL